MASLTALLRLIGELVGQVVPSGIPESSLLLVAMVGAVAVIALAVTTRVTVPSRAASPLLAAPPELGLAVSVTQSHPDADGHTRSRAPGLAL